MTPLLVDTGFLVALYIRGDSLHSAAVEWLQQNRSPLQTVAPVIVEACFFLDPSGKDALFTQCERCSWRGAAVTHCARFRLSCSVPY